MSMQFLMRNNFRKYPLKQDNIRTFINSRTFKASLFVSKFKYFKDLQVLYEPGYIYYKFFNYQLTNSSIVLCLAIVCRGILEFPKDVPTLPFSPLLLHSE